MRTKIIFFLIVLLASFLRLYRLDTNPPSVYGDEQAFAWNAWNILKTGKDEYGNFLPLQFKSFNDYKSAAPVYLLVPFQKFLGMSPFSTRLPLALFGILAVIITFFLVRLFLPTSNALLTSFLLAISPWHIHLSRGFFEANLALTFFILAIYFFLRARQDRKYFYISALFFVVTFYTYLTPRILIPILFIFLTWFSRDWIFKVKRYLLIFLLVIFSLGMPIFKMALQEEGATRFWELMGMRREKVEEYVRQERVGSYAPQLLRILMHNKALIYMREFKNNYFEHFSLNFWYIYGDNSLRYFTGNMGMFYLFELPFLIFGILFLIKEKRNAAIFFLGWMLIAPVPAALVGRPFAVRSLAMLPAPFIFVSYGIYKFYQVMTKKDLRNLSLVILFIGFSLSISSWFLRYHLDYPAYGTDWWGWENKVAIEFAKKNENDYEKIFISDYYTGTTLAYAFYQQLDPTFYRERLNNPVNFNGHQFINFGKFYIGSFALDQASAIKKIIPPHSLYIAGPLEEEGQSVIKSPADGRALFKIHKT